MDLFHSAVATGCAEILTLPICTVKTNYQNTKARSVGDTIRTMYTEGGVRTFFRASGPALASQMFSTSSKYYIYRGLEEHYNREGSALRRILHGICSGTACSLVTHPIDFVRVHWQMRAQAWKSVHENGFLTVYRGYRMTLGKVVLSSSIFFPLYEYLKIDHGCTPLTASGLTAVAGVTIMQPFDYSKTRMIYGLPHWTLQEAGVYNMIRCYYRGVLLNYARVVPHFIIVMSLINWMGRTSPPAPREGNSASRKGNSAPREAE